MIKINLLPREIIAKEQQKQYATQAVLIAAFLAILVAMVSAAHWYKAARLEAKLKSEKQKLDALQEIVDKVKALEQTVSVVRTRLNVVTDLLKGRPLYPYFMMDLSKTLPSGVWLTQLGARNQANNQLGVTATANASSAEAIADWLRNLQGSGKFAEPTLSAISISGEGANRLHSFSVTTSYHSPDL